MPRLLLAAVFTFAALCAPARAATTWTDWNTARIVSQQRTPVFTVDGKPFFVYGAAFFYERVPRARWRDDLLAYKRLGINTIDLYTMWNWHEPSPGVVDVDGTTNPRRDLRGLLKLVHDLGFKIILRPGPVIRNEWRNGGYPDYLLREPAYDMPLHDVLEGRYPATATYQNAHADAAADEWLHNPTHLRAAAAWLRTVLHDVEPWSHDVLAIALDDDQGAYIDNDTYPAPHWHAYMDWLKTTVRGVTGPRVPLFINTFQMKVTASAPVWAWGNWYQSDAYRIGDHDLAQLAFSTALLRTQPGMPVMASEFQAGWLQGADEITPRAAAPENTTLALHEMLQLGTHGVVNFPVQDTYDPSGWEAPWTNWFYAWDAALRADGTPSKRAVPTARFGALVRAYGPLLATLQPVDDLAIAWLPSAYEPAQTTNDRVAHLADLTIAQQQRCRALALTCRLIDLRYATNDDIRRTRFLVVPATGFPIAFDPSISNRLYAFRAYGGRLAGSVDEAVAMGVRPSNGGIRDATLLTTPDGRAGVLDAFNAGDRILTTRAATISLGDTHYRITPLHIDAGGARDLLLSRGTVRDITPAARAPVVVAARDPFADDRAITLDNGTARVVIAPNAGARVFVFENRATHRNLFTTIGVARDDVATPPSPSPRDYIAPYTHPLAAGTFNRVYACVQPTRFSVRCTYDAPDLGPSPVHFEKTFTLDPAAPKLTIDVYSSAPARSISAIADDPSIAVEFPNEDGVFHTSDKRPGYQLVTLSYPANRHVTYTLVQGPPPPAPKPPTSPGGSGGMADAAASKAAEATRVGSSPTFPTNHRTDENHVGSSGSRSRLSRRSASRDR